MDRQNANTNDQGGILETDSSQRSQINPAIVNSVEMVNFQTDSNGAAQPIGFSKGESDEDETDQEPGDEVLPLLYYSNPSIAGMGQMSGGDPVKLLYEWGRAGRRRMALGIPLEEVEAQRRGRAAGAGGVGGGGGFAAASVGGGGGGPGGGGGGAPGAAGGAGAAAADPLRDPFLRGQLLRSQFTITSWPAAAAAWGDPSGAAAARALFRRRRFLFAATAVVAAVAAAVAAGVPGFDASLVLEQQGYYPGPFERPSGGGGGGAAAVAGWLATAYALLALGAAAAYWKRAGLLRLFAAGTAAHAVCTLLWAPPGGGGVPAAALRGLLDLALWRLARGLAHLLSVEYVNVRILH